MTGRERMLAAIRGEPTDRMPWAPRLDLWYAANQRAGTLPATYRHATLREMIDDLGWDYHGVVPDFQDLRSPDDNADRALGIWNLWPVPVRIVFEHVRRTVRRDGDRTIVRYETPHGTLRTVTVYDDAMRAGGVTISHVAERAFKSAADYPALGHLFEHARAVPNVEGYEEFAGFVGERGIAVGWGTVAASPMHWVQRELMPIDVFFYEMHDRPAAMERLAEQVGELWDRLMAVLLGGPAGVVLVGANYDSMIQYPPFFQRHIVPWLGQAARDLHAQGKCLLTHTDGENQGLLDHYLACEIDVADSVCPAPMTKLTFREVRDVFAGRITIMGGIPSVALLPETLDDREFAAFLDGFFEACGRGDHLILGISDTTPPGADFARLRKIADRVEAFGPVSP